MLEKTANKNYLISAFLGNIYSIAGFLLSIKFLNGEGLYIVLSVLIASRVLSWKKWIALLKNRLDLFVSSIIQCVTAIVFIVWESLIHTMAFNIILIIFSIIASTEGMLLAALSRRHAKRSVKNDAAAIFATILLCYATLLLLSGGVPFGV